MGYRNREIETKLIVYNRSLSEVNTILDELFGSQKTRLLFGSSQDTYWRIDNQSVDADFIRMRERDGIRQITVKGKDKGTNLDRMEIDIDSTTEVSKISKLLTAAHGKPAGKIGKTYYVYWLGYNEHTTVCCYDLQMDEPNSYSNIFIEVETINQDRMLELEQEVLDRFRRDDIKIERAPGSLYEMFILGVK